MRDVLAYSRTRVDEPIPLRNSHKTGGLPTPRQHGQHRQLDVRTEDGWSQPNGLTISRSTFRQHNYQSVTCNLL
jgi:hypothetical protein